MQKNGKNLGHETSVPCLYWTRQGERVGWTLTVKEVDINEGYKSLEDRQGKGG